MDKLIALFPQQLLEALKIGTSGVFSKPRNIDCVVISGMGGSGIGGSIVRDYALQQTKVPIILNKDYGLPACVSENSLVIVCSYSGNTEETVSALNYAVEIGAFVVCITSGGRIKKMAEEHQKKCFLIPSGMPPRACLGYSLVQILFTLHYCDLIDDSFIEDIKQSVDLLTSHSEEMKGLAAKMAKDVQDKTIVVYAGNQFDGVAVRWRQQVNENSKMLGWSSAIPEMNHNELVGWHDKNESLAVFFLCASSDYSRVKLRQKISRKIIERCTPFVFTIDALGSSYWDEAFSLIYIGDWLSYYLAELHHVDATEVTVIEHLKRELNRPTSENLTR